MSLQDEHADIPSPCRPPPPSKTEATPAPPKTELLIHRKPLPLQVYPQTQGCPWAPRGSCLPLIPPKWGKQGSLSLEAVFPGAFLLDSWRFIEPRVLHGSQRWNTLSTLMGYVPLYSGVRKGQRGLRPGAKGPGDIALALRGPATTLQSPWEPSVGNFPAGSDSYFTI